MKRSYRTPELTTVKIDNTITLVMYSDETNPPPPPPPPGGAPANTTNDTFKNDSFDKSPFK